jgi:surfeit locus 1 family protein
MRLRGRYDPDHQILLDARVAGGQNGYEVLTPLRSGNSAVLVNRGWLPAAADRSQLPDVTVAGGERAVAGRLDRLPRPGLTMTAPPGAGWPRRMLFPTAEEISAALGYRVHDYQLLLAPEEPHGYQRRWEPQIMSPRQHLGYAVQWFALAAALGVIYVALNLKRPDA